MKINVEIDCTPQEARTFLGLPDVAKANEFYVDAIAKAMKGAGNVEQVQEFAKNIAPMGQVGLKLFQQFMESGNAFSAGAGKKKDEDARKAFIAAANRDRQVGHDADDAVAGNVIGSHNDHHISPYVTGDPECGR